jgi:hypothetical protein
MDDEKLRTNGARGGQTFTPYVKRIEYGHLLRDAIKLQDQLTDLYLFVDEE